MGAVDRSNGGILGVDNASKSELVTAFPSSGTFTARASTTAVDVLVVAGGGGGGGGASGSGNHGGGGGAGGLVLTSGLTMPGGSSATVGGVAGSGQVGSVLVWSRIIPEEDTIWTQIVAA